jgi:hypothetical protein
MTNIVIIETGIKLLSLINTRRATSGDENVVHTDLRDLLCDEIGEVSFIDFNTKKNILIRREAGKLMRQTTEDVVGAAFPFNSKFL